MGLLGFVYSSSHTDCVIYRLVSDACALELKIALQAAHLERP